MRRCGAQLILQMKDETTGRKPAISIIVPVYNVEKYLKECLDSIEAQTFSDWECILVDDGSTDRSGEICDEFARRDVRFRVVHQANKGLSGARNTAIRIAQGDYIAFVDSDDWIAPEMMAHLHKLITENNADVAQVGFSREYDGFSRVKGLVETTVVFDGVTALRELVKDKRLPSYVWNKMFRREIALPDFPEGKNFEDLYTMTRWFRRVGTMVCDPTPLYHYRMRRGSIIYSNFAENRRDYIDVCRYRADMMAEIDPDTFTADLHDAFVTKASVNAAKTIARLEPDKAKRREIIAEIGEKLRQEFPQGGKNLSLKTRLRAAALKHHPRFFAWLMRAVYKTDFQSHHRLRHLYD